MGRTKNPDAVSAWTDLLGGRVTAKGAPGRQGLTTWATEGATDVVTLQRSHEHGPWLAQACADAGMSWHHLPLSGRRLDQDADRVSLARVPELLELLRRNPPRSVILHCSAGLHRTGICLYLLLRHAGFDPEAALVKLAAARPLTAKEVKRQGKRGSLQAQAETLLAPGGIVALAAGEPPTS